MTATIEAPAKPAPRIVHHAKQAFASPDIPQTQAELEQAMLDALNPPPPSLGGGSDSSDQSKQDQSEQDSQDQEPKGQESSEKKQSESKQSAHKESKPSKPGKPQENKQQESKPQDGKPENKKPESGEKQKPQGKPEGQQGDKQDQAGEGEQSESDQGESGQGDQQGEGDGEGQGEQGQGQGQQGQGQSGSPSGGGSGQGSGQSSGSSELTEEDMEGLPQHNAEQIKQQLIQAAIDKMLDGSSGQGEPGDGQQKPQGKQEPGQLKDGSEGAKGESSGVFDHDAEATGGERAEHKGFDDHREVFEIDARVLTTKKGLRIETVLTNLQAVEQLAVTTDSFGRNLYAKYRQYGKLTGEQMAHAHRIAMKELKPNYKNVLI